MSVSIPKTIDKIVDLSCYCNGDFKTSVHVFDDHQIDAIHAAIGAGRPLLVRGEPGVGKSQLAQAAAKALQWAYIPFVADARTEARDLLWSFDAVKRLADAQANSNDKDLNLQNYIKPGPLWWAFDWETAKEQQHAQTPPIPETHENWEKNGRVVLIDEIDKTDSDVANGLLEAFGMGQFTVHGPDIIVKNKSQTPILIIITTNEERALPDAFLRRCMVLHLNLDTEIDKATEQLIRIGQAHFEKDLSQDIISEAATVIAQERADAHSAHRPPLPGKAEYLDLLRSLKFQQKHLGKNPAETLNTVAKFVLHKNVYDA